MCMPPQFALGSCQVAQLVGFSQAIICRKSFPGWRCKSQKLRSFCVSTSVIKMLSHSTRKCLCSIAKQRLAEDFNAPSKHGIKKLPNEAAVNRKHAYLYAVFKELKRLGHWKSDKKLDGVKALLRN